MRSLTVNARRLSHPRSCAEPFPSSAVVSRDSREMTTKLRLGTHIQRERSSLAASTRYARTYAKVSRPYQILVPRDKGARLVGVIGVVALCVAMS